MRSGRAAAVAIDHCLTPAEPDTSAENISLYDDLWHTEVAPKMQSRLAMTELLYLASNDRYDRLVGDLARLDDDTLAKANQGNPLALARLLHLGDASLLAEFARRRLGV
jgi:digeranylgeranylglycerophospholipid reductase